MGISWKAVAIVAGVIVAWRLLVWLLGFLANSLEKMEKRQNERVEKEKEDVSNIRHLIRWEQEGDRYYCIVSICDSAPFKYLKKEALEYILLGWQRYEDNALVDAGSTILYIKGTNLAYYGYNNEQGIISPAKGIITYYLNKTADSHIYLNQRIICIDTSETAIAEYIAIKEQEAEERRQKALEAEKAEIAAKIKAKHRKQQLEKIVRQELVDSGELFGEQAKRPRIPREVVDAVYSRDGGRCVYCGSTENLHLDHIIPFSRGGATNVENLQLLCQKCNLEKSNKIG